MEAPAFPRYITLPQVAMPRTGDFRADVVALLSELHKALTDRAVAAAMENAFPITKRALAGSQPKDHRTPAIAASIVNQLKDIICDA
jgi:hypothetical protein